MSEPTPESAPASKRYACIDVGTNSIKMTVAALGEAKAESVLDMSAITRLGEGMHAQAPRMREVAMRRTLDSLVEFAQAARDKGAQAIVAVGTAALRDAENRDDFVRRAQEQSGVAVEVIPGEEEARLSYLAVRRDPHWRSEPQLIVIDVGGGSTEIIEGEENSTQVAARISVNLGAVKLTETYLRSDPPTITQLAAANQAAQQHFAQVEVPPHVRALPVVGVGGTMTNLAAMNLGRFMEPEALHGYLLDLDDLENQISRLAAATVAERKEFPGLDPKRADIILGGAILLSQALARLGSDALSVSTRGLRWGVLYDRFLP